MLDRWGERAGNGLEDIEQTSQELNKLKLAKKWILQKELKAARDLKALGLPFVAIFWFAIIGLCFMISMGGDL